MAELSPTFSTPTLVDDEEHKESILVAYSEPSTSISMPQGKRAVNIDTLKASGLKLLNEKLKEAYPTSDIITQQVEEYKGLRRIIVLARIWPLAKPIFF